MPYCTVGSPTALTCVSIAPSDCAGSARALTTARRRPATGQCHPVCGPVPPAQLRGWPTWTRGEQHTQRPRRRRATYKTYNAATAGAATAGHRIGSCGMYPTGIGHGRRVQLGPLGRQAPHVAPGCNVPHCVASRTLAKEANRLEPLVLQAQHVVEVQLAVLCDVVSRGHGIS